MKNYIKSSAYILFLFIFCSCAYLSDQNEKTNANEKNEVTQSVTELRDTLEKDTVRSKYLKHIIWQSTQEVTYDPSYFVLKYPNGDVPSNKGVCVDVPIRGLRTIGIDLQKLVHEDIKSHLSAYHLNHADRNIDHRRCVNLIIYFKRQNQTIPVSDKEEDYHPGDIVFWDIARGHVGVVTNKKVPGTNRYYLVHNICCGPQMEDFLFAAPIVCHVPYVKLVLVH